MEDARQLDAELLEAQRVAQVGSWHWDVARDRVTWSQELYRIAGRDPRKPAPNYKEHAQLYAAESWTQLKRAVKKALRTGSPYDIELEMLRRDGTKRWIRARGEALRNASGRVVVLRGTAQDISEKKEAERSLRESEERFRSVFRDAGIGMVIVSLEGRFLAANGAFCEYLGYTEEELLRQSVKSVTHPEDWEAFSRVLHEAVAQGKNFQRFEKRCIHKTGQLVWTESSGSVIRDANGKARYFVGEVLDVTQRKLADQALASINRKLIEAQEQERTRVARELHDDVAQSVALLTAKMDEIKNAPPPRKEDFRAHMNELIAQAGQIAADIHAISHSLHSSRLEHLGVVSAMGGFCREYAGRQKVEIRFSHQGIPPRIPEEISLCLFRVLQEALQNATRHSGARHFQVHFYGTEEEVGLRVSDTGRGFDPGRAMHQQGLGLTSMHERLRLVGGTLSVESTPDKGTTIHAHVPLVRQNHSAVA